MDSSESALGAEFFLTKSGWYDIMDVQTEIRRMISALHKLFAYIFPDSKKKSIADYLYTQLPRIKSFNDWVCVFGEALNV